ncbi:MAG: HAD family hydrolase [Desulfobulbus sp.]|jgi:phosphoglycolate phosphatase|nr:HAD family hydrolase [Desulfobulbus sp.]
MRYKAILFDLDGTLLDTLEDLAVAANRALVSLGLPAHPVAAYRLFVGDGLRILAERLLPEAQRTVTLIDALVAAFEREYSRNWNERSAPYAGIPEMLDQLTDDGYRLSVLSNKPDAFTRLCVEQLLPRWTFAPLLGQRSGVPKKPDPAGALEITAELALKPAEVLYLGDTATDMLTARAAGMEAIGVLWGFRAADELREAGAHHLIGHPAELAPLLR